MAEQCGTKSSLFCHQLFCQFCYAAGDERANHAQGYPKDKIPPKEKPISHRDWRLPKGPF